MGFVFGTSHHRPGEFLCNSFRHIAVEKPYIKTKYYYGFIYLFNGSRSLLIYFFEVQMKHTRGDGYRYNSKTLAVSDVTLSLSVTSNWSF